MLAMQQATVMHGAIVMLLMASIYHIFHPCNQILNSYHVPHATQAFAPPLA